MVGHHPARDLDVKQSTYSIFWPWCLHSEFFESQGFWVEKGRCWAAGDIVAEEGGEVDNKRKAKGHTGSAESVCSQWMFVYQFWKTYGPPNS
jgi:hypothetical protein